MRKKMGALMSAFMMLAACGGGILKTSPTYTTNTTWTAPATTGSLVTLVGRGGAGEPAYDDPDGYMKRTRYKEWTNGTLTKDESTYTFHTGATPSDYCEGGQSSGGVTWERCYTHTFMDNEGPATTGGTTTAFGKSFPGGTGGTAATFTYTNVPVTPGQTYSLVIPSGGRVTVTYYE